MNKTRIVVWVFVVLALVVTIFALRKIMNPEAPTVPTFQVEKKYQVPPIPPQNVKSGQDKG